MNLSQRLINYQKKHKLTADDLFLKLRAFGLVVSMASVKNWVTNKTEPSQMFRAGIENFLSAEAKIER